MKLNGKTKIAAAYILSVFSILIIWLIAAAIINAPLILPYPKAVFLSLIKILGKPFFWMGFLYTLKRCFISFLITIFIGTILGLICGFSSFFKSFIEIPVAFVRTTPVIAVILVALFWFKSGTVPVFVSVLMTLPIMISSVVSGFNNFDEKLLEMAAVYELNKKQIFWNIKLPAILPYFYNGIISCFGLTWKVVVAGEVLSLPDKGLGSILQKAQVHLETEEVIAVALFMVFISFILEKILMHFLSKKVGSYAR